MGEETNAYDPAGSQFDDDVTAERPTDRAAQSGQKAQATARAAEPVKPLISMSDLPDLRNTFNPNAPLDDSNDLSRDEFTTVYDIIDKLESALDEAKPILFFPGSVRDRPRRIHRTARPVEENDAGAAGTRLGVDA